MIVRPHSDPEAGRATGRRASAEGRKTIAAFIEPLFRSREVGYLSYSESLQSEKRYESKSR